VGTHRNVTTAIQVLPPLPEPRRAEIAAVLAYAAQQLGVAWGAAGAVGSRLAMALEELEIDLMMRSGFASNAAWSRKQTAVPKVYADAIGGHYDLHRRRGRPRNATFVDDFLCRLALLAHDDGHKRSQWSGVIAVVLRARGLKHIKKKGLCEALDRQLRRLGNPEVVLGRGRAAENAGSLPD
jgi:hypothetical protein